MDFLFNISMDLILWVFLFLLPGNQIQAVNKFSNCHRTFLKNFFIFIETTKMIVDFAEM